jgi:hypothetical protein
MRPPHRRMLDSLFESPSKRTAQQQGSIIGRFGSVLLDPFNKDRRDERLEKRAIMAQRAGSSVIFASRPQSLAPGASSALGQRPQSLLPGMPSMFNPRAQSLLLASLQQPPQRDQQPELAGDDALDTAAELKSVASTTSSTDRKGFVRLPTKAVIGESSILTEEMRAKLRWGQGARAGGTRRGVQRHCSRAAAIACEARRPGRAACAHSFRSRALLHRRCRPDEFTSAWQVAKEVLLVAWRMVWAWGAITQEEFSVMRASFFVANK